MRMSPLGAADLGVVAVFQFLFLLGIIVTTKIRLRLPTQIAVRIVQGICALIFLMFALVNFIDFIGAYSRMPDFIRSKTVGDFLVILMIQLTIIAAAILAIVHAVALQIRTDTLSRIAMGLIYGAIGCAIAYIVIRPVILTEEPAIILTILHCLFLTIPIIFLFCSGLIGFICGLVVKMGNAPRTAAPRRAPAQAPAPSGGDTSVQGRLRKLESLKTEGLITNDEYNAKRTEILGKL
ncbi:MAG: SHOCT domain-containing protein [Phycisphaerales bacterium]|nr:SHOCT domain-containing protein [Phycisphaerales bacterium]